MKRIRHDYHSETTEKKTTKSPTTRRTRTPEDTREHRTAQQVIIKARKHAMWKAITTFTPSNTTLTDQQRISYVPICLPGGDNASQNENLQGQPSTFLLEAPYWKSKRPCTPNAPNQGGIAPWYEFMSRACVRLGLRASAESTLNTCTDLSTPHSKHDGTAH